MPEKKFWRIFFATDLHGSDRCFNKFVSAASFYKADTLVLGGDITGKMMVPIIDWGDGTYRAEFLGKETVLTTGEEIDSMERKISDSGFYPYHCGKSEMDDLKHSKEKVDVVFRRLMRERLIQWFELAERFLAKVGITCYFTGGNDDDQELIDAISDTAHVRNSDHRVVQIDQLHQMLNLGWSNQTPWKCPRDHTEQDLADAITKLMSSVEDGANCVYNVHPPPINTELDICPKLDVSVFPPKPIIVKGQQIMFGAGSEAIRAAVEKYQPLLHLCGHIHESRGATRIGKTLVINPGSEYGEGILRGAIVNLGDKKVLSWQLTSG
jgi:Icc-related predicted phosphoesterase